MGYLNLENNNFKKHQYKGAIHIHSLNSDGSGDIETITRAAQKAGLSWIIITDHNYFDLKEAFDRGELDEDDFYINLQEVINEQGQ